MAMVPGACLSSLSHSQYTSSTSTGLSCGALALFLNPLTSSSLSIHVKLAGTVGKPGISRISVPAQSWSIFILALEVEVVSVYLNLLHTQCSTLINCSID